MNPLLVLLFVPFSYATIPYNATIHEHAVSSCTSTRTLWGIIKSCAVTIFACTWTAIHPNIPGFEDSPWSVRKYRLCVMILAISAPELVVMWAIRQLFDAHTTHMEFQKEIKEDEALALRMQPCCELRPVKREALCDAGKVKSLIHEVTNKSWFQALLSLWSSISTKFRRTSSSGGEKSCSPSTSVKPLWTQKHSFYAWMGGFVLCINSSSTQRPYEIYCSLTPDELLRYLKEDRVEVTMVSEKEIDDRSKRDWLSKAIAASQLAWFILQLASRGFMQSPAALLEIDSLAIAVISCFTYGFWWNKPKNVQCPVLVYWKGPVGSLKDDLTYKTPRGVTAVLKPLGFTDSSIIRLIAKPWLPLLNLIGFDCVLLSDVGACRVPYLCGYSPVAGKDALKPVTGKNALKRVTLPSIVGCLAGIVFGGIHCGAWNFHFQTPIEKLLWRISSVQMTATPCICLVVLSYVHWVADQYGDTINQHVTTLLAIFLCCLTILYSTCRLIVAVLTFLSLRRVPDALYHEVAWVSFIPHL